MERPIFVGKNSIPVPAPPANVDKVVPDLSQRVVKVAPQSVEILICKYFN